MGNGSENSVNCIGKACGWGSYNTRLGCQTGNGSCRSAKFLTAGWSEFHPKALQQATDEINQILKKAEADALAEISQYVQKEGAGLSENRHKLSFIITEMGIMLALVEHSEITVAKGDKIVTAESDKDDVINALKLNAEGIDSWQSAQQAY